MVWVHLPSVRDKRTVFIMETAIAKKLRSHTWTIVLLYVLIGTCWIFFSDALTNTLFTDQQVANVQLYKGTFFILITATFLFFVIRRKNQSIQSLFANVRRSMKDFRDTFEQSAVGIAHMSVDGEWIRINKKLCNILGYSRSELLSTPIADIIHPDDLQEGYRKDQKLIDGEWDSYVTEKRYITKSGRCISARLTKSVIKDRQGNIKYLSGILEDISKQKETENQLLESLQEKKRLLSEIHHRVKNNLAVISGLLELQAFNSTNQAVKKILKESLMRIKSIALIHESYYKSETLAGVYLDEYLNNFVNYVRQNFANTHEHITLNYATDRVPLNINQAIPCGLLLNELLINAYLHAFEAKKKGTISIELSQKGKSVILQVSDNGVGLPESVNIQNPTSLGLTIIQTLVKQLDGSISVQREQGTIFTITFSKVDKKGSSGNLKVNTLP